MDYLDPKKKKLKRAQLMIGYVLLAVIIGIFTIFFVYLAHGYYIDRETGNVIQNGLIYLDSKPESAKVFLNGRQQSGQTDARLVVPEGTYNIELKRDGYLTWSRSLILEGGSLRRLTYARLIPETLESESALNLPAMPTMVSQSIDKRWAVLGFADDPLMMRLVDLNRSDLTLTNFSLPGGLLDATEPGTWEVLDWSDDNRTFLAEYRTASSVEYALIDRADPASSIKLKTAFAATPYTSVTLRDRKNNLVFLHDDATGKLYRGNANNGEVELFLENVLSYTAFENDNVLYTTNKDSKEGYVAAVLKRGNDEYKLREIKEDTSYLLEMSKLGNALVMGIGSQAEGRVIVYNDPINALSKNDFSDLPVPTTVLRVDNPQELSISSDSSVIIARSGQSFGSHEFEADRTYLFEMDSLLDENQELRWVEGQHFTVSSAGNQIISDFDGSNQHILSASDPVLGSLFDGAIDEQYSFVGASEDGAPPHVLRTFMRSAADR